MIIDPLSPTGSDLPVQISKQAGDPDYVETEIVNFAGISVTGTGDSPEEKAEVKKAFREEVQKRVARHLAKKRAAMPPVPSTEIQNIIDNWTKDVSNVSYFIDNKGGDEE